MDFFSRATHRGRRFAAVAATLLLAGVSTVVASVPAAPPAAATLTSGYWLVGTDGGVFSYGAARFHGSTGAIPLNQPIAGMAATPDGRGYWMVASDGGIFAFDAPFLGSMGGKPLNQPIVGMAPTRTGRGYWLVASDGGIFAFGDAGFFGSMGATKLNKPIVDIVPTPTGRGYWMAASDGGIFAFGDAGFFGSTGAIKLAKRIQQMASTPSGRGYWMVAGDGGIFAFGDAGFFGSAAAEGAPDKRIVDIAPSASGKGYYLTSSAGAVYAYGDAKPYGGAEKEKLTHGIISIVALNNGDLPVAGDDTINLVEDGLGTVDALANDRDPDGGPLTIVAVQAPPRGGSATFAGGTITYRPAPDLNGSDTFAYTVSDDHGNLGVGLVRVSIRPVNDLPATRDDSVSGDEDVPFGIDVLANDSGIGDTPISLGLYSAPHLGTATVVGGRILYTPRPDANGSDLLTYRVVDADGQFATAEVKINIRPVNDLPVAVNVGPVDCTAGRCEADVLRAPGAKTGESNGAIRLENAGQDGKVVVSEGTFSISGDRIFFAPANGGVPGASVDFRIVDDNNKVGAEDVSNLATVSFKFENSAPTASDGSAQIANNTGYSGQLAGDDPDGAGDIQEYVVDSSNGPFHLIDAAKGTFTFDPTTIAGPYELVFHVRDSSGAVSNRVHFVVTVMDPPPAA